MYSLVDSRRNSPAKFSTEGKLSFWKCPIDHITLNVALRVIFLFIPYEELIPELLHKKLWKIFPCPLGFNIDKIQMLWQ